MSSLKSMCQYIQITENYSEICRISPHLAHRFFFFWLIIYSNSTKWEKSIDLDKITKIKKKRGIKYAQKIKQLISISYYFIIRFFLLVCFFFSFLFIFSCLEIFFFFFGRSIKKRWECACAICVQFIDQQKRHRDKFKTNMWSTVLYSDSYKL